MTPMEKGSAQTDFVSPIILNKKSKQAPEVRKAAWVTLRALNWDFLGANNHLVSIWQKDTHRSTMQISPFTALYAMQQQATST